MRGNTLIRRWPMISVIVVMALVVGGLGTTHLTGSLFAGGDTIEACANGQHLRIVDNSTTDCKQNEEGLSWNQQGIQGEQGPQAKLEAKPPFS